MTETQGCVTCGGPYRGDKERSVVHDPLYRGSYGHSVIGQCYECHVSEWEDGMRGWISAMLGLTGRQFLRLEGDPERRKESMN